MLSTQHPWREDARGPLGLCGPPTDSPSALTLDGLPLGVPEVN